ncbi:MAG: potassium channel family protein [Thermodesulfobacteriota bacterium]
MKKFTIIGLGNFGYYLATRLYKKGYDVLAIDKNPVQVQAIKDNVSQAVVADTTDRATVTSLGLKEMDTIAVCIGSDLAASILTILNLLEIGVKKVVAKAISEPHQRILHKLGIMETFFPEKDLAISMAEKLHNPNMLDYLPFMEGYGIVEFATPTQFIGKSLRELDLINKFGIQIVAIKEIVPERLNVIPTAQFVLKDSDIMILIGPNESIEKLRKKVS